MVAFTVTSQYKATSLQFNHSKARVKAWLDWQTLLQRKRFLSLAARETYVAGTKFAARKQEMFLPQTKNVFAFIPDTNFASETYVSQFSHHESNVD